MKTVEAQKCGGLKNFSLILRTLDFIHHTFVKWKQTLKHSNSLQICLFPSFNEYNFLSSPYLIVPLLYSCSSKSTYFLWALRQKLNEKSTIGKIFVNENFMYTWNYNAVERFKNSKILTNFPFKNWLVSEENQPS